MTGNKPEKSEFAEIEERILKFWQKEKIFERTLAKPSPKGEFVFYEGPPTANGRPGIHHLEARAFKDAIPRYKTMQGYHVARRAGWDTHGLPVELEVERELALKSKKDIEKYGIERFNKKCRESVLKYLTEWNAFTRRIGFWVDQENPYFTFDPKFMESVWWVIKQAAEKNLLYKDYRVVPWCPRCGTGLSSHELGQPGAYSDVRDISVFVKFKIKDQAWKNTSVLAWTTTPWTLPGNVALAIGSAIDYVKIKVGEEFFILARERLAVIKEPYEIVEEMRGHDLLGLSYEPLFSFLSENLVGREREKLANAFKIYPAEFVTTLEGTGVVHTAVMYGADDFALGTAIGLPKFHLVGEDGTFKSETGAFAGLPVRAEETAVAIIKDLAARGLLYAKEKHLHSYPHCWRCKTALIYFARDSWYIRMSDLRTTLVRENEEINWEPAHIKEGRFGEWLREAKDWNISRERFWGTPLPIWQCRDCSEKIVVGGVAEIKEKIKKSGNKYFVCRHGLSENNIASIASTKDQNESGLTKKGREDVKKISRELAEKKIDLIFSSPFLRTRQTAEIIAAETGLPPEKIIIDDRLREINVGEFDGRPISEYRSFFASNIEKFDKRPLGGETMQEVRRRVMQFFYEAEKKYENKNILVVSHGDPIWAAIGGVAGMTKFELSAMKDKNKEIIDQGHWRELDFIPLPHNEDFELDLHRPFIDQIVLTCSCGSDALRTPEVLDVWFDSGAMPFAQSHYPFENKDFIDTEGYPADFISEAIDQTRGWFYTLHAVGAIVGKGRAFKNVICLGHVLDAKGKKMSKSLGNALDANFEIAKYGADLLRFFMYAVNQPGESKNYDEKVVVEISKKTFSLLFNVLKFFETYTKAGDRSDTIKDSQAGKDIQEKIESANLLDRWILAELQKLINTATKAMDDYRIFEAARAIREFIFDLSQWYLRRSRERFKGVNPEELKEKENAIKTTQRVLKDLARLLAPLAPMLAEDIWQRTGGAESVHLADWPETKTVAEATIAEMNQIRGVVTKALETRNKAGVKVRQPLARLFIKEKISQEGLAIIADELNVKEVIIDPTLSEMMLDVKITPALKKEGDLREILRTLQDFRKQKGLPPGRKVSIAIEAEDATMALIKEFTPEIKKAAAFLGIEFTKTTQGAMVGASPLSFKIEIRE